MLKKVLKIIIIRLTNFYGLGILKAINLFNYYIIHFFSFSKFKSEQIRRQNIDLFDYLELAKSLPLICNSYYLNNDFYGHNHILKKYMSINNDLFWIIEHGIGFGENPDPFAEDFNDFLLVVTYGDFREIVNLKFTTKKILKIGPYIHYTNPLLNKIETDLLKNKLGRVLLVFPMHATNQVHYLYDDSFFIQEIKKRQTNYDNVIICMYWKDIQLGLHLKFKASNFLITCAGHIMDQNFLPRLKTIITISDEIFTNTIGTHIGYAVFMNKKIEYIEQEITQIVGSSENIKTNHPKDVESFLKKEAEVKNAFVKDSEYSEDQRYNLVNDLWGFNHIKNPKELKDELKKINVGKN